MTAVLDLYKKELEPIFGANKAAGDRILEFARITKPNTMVLVTDPKSEYKTLTSMLRSQGRLIRLNPKKYPNSYLYRSDQNDVARTEQKTFICTTKEEDAGPTNNWMMPELAKQKLFDILEGSMRRSEMYVLPYLLGPANSRHSQAGIQLTDDPYVVILETVIAKVGEAAIRRLENLSDFVFGVHSSVNLDPNNRYICHFPEEKLIISVNTAYGGNALLSKKCHALRIASFAARNEGWMAEHMMAIEVEDPAGKRHGIVGAFPSASGKTNLAMIRPPKDFKNWSVRLVSDDISWMHSADGQLRALNPESGFFGVARGTNERSNPNIMATISKNAIFTNTALTPNMEPWWEGLEKTPPPGLIDWTGNLFVEGNAAHPNSRFTTPIPQYQNLSPRYYDPEGMPVSAMLFGGRRRELVPLIFESYSWEHGVLIGAMMRAETTAAKVGQVGKLENDPMAMKPFCGYNMANYFDHWGRMGLELEDKPRIFNVNWFKTGENGEFLWPGYGDNMRVIKWVIERKDGFKDNAVETPIGYVPDVKSFDKGGVSEETIKELLRFDKDGWLKEVQALKPFFDSFADRFPKWLWKEYDNLEERLKAA